MQEMTEQARDTLMKLVEEHEGDLDEVVAEYEHQGICLHCGTLADTVEPDAEGYHCDDCGQDAVAGLENAIMYHLY